MENIFKRTPTFWLIIGLFFFSGFLVYHQSLWNPFVRWDDGLLIYDNPAIRAITPKTIAKVFTSYDPELYIPLTFISYQIDYAIGGTSPTIYHLTNLLFHTLNALLVCWFFTLLGFRRFVAVVCGLLFLLHPLNTEAVVWASARKDVLSIFFGLCSLNLYLVYRNENRKIWLTFSLVLFLMALLSKVILAVLPAVLLLFLWQRSSLSKQELFRLSPYFLLSGIFIIVAIFGKRDVLASATLWETALMAAKSTVFYIQKFIMPTGLSVLYPYTDTIAISSIDFLLPVVAVLLLGGYGMYALWKKQQIGLAIALFFIALVPTYSNFSKGGDYYFASDRYAYFALLGLLWLVAIAFEKITAKLNHKNILYGSSIALLGIFGWMSTAQANVWSSTESLFQHAVELYPNAHVAHANIANMYNRDGKLDAALKEYTIALQIHDHPRTRSNVANVYRKQKLYEQSEAEYNHALQQNPDAKEAHFGLGVLYAELGKYDQAISSYTRALEIDPTYAEVNINFGALYMQLDNLDAALEQFDRALAIIPYSPEANYNRAVALRKLKRTKEAIEAYENAIKAEPSFVAARINLALLYHERGRIEEAIEQFQTVLQYDPGNSRAISALQQLGVR